MLGSLHGHFLNGDHDRAVAGLPLRGLASRNALIEAFQIHARNLIDFLTDQPSRREATAADFTVQEWSIAGGDRRALKRLSGEFSQRVAHLSWQRSQLDPAQQRVMTDDIYDAIRRYLLAFLEHVDPDRVCSGFIQDVGGAMFAQATGPSVPREQLPGELLALRERHYTHGTATGPLRSTADPG